MKYKDPVYGSTRFIGFPEKVIRHPVLQRLKKIHQNGAKFLVNPAMNTSRFEHSLGVAIICKKFDCDEKEVVAALLHDISHTAFSHLIDQIYGRKEQTFHEDCKEYYIKKYKLNEFLRKNGYNPNYILNEDNFTILERDLPNLCADRLDYTFRDLYKAGLVDKETIQKIFKGMTVKKGKIVAKNEETAWKILELSEKLNKEIFFNQIHEAADLLFKEILTEAIDKGLIERKGLFSNDKKILSIIKKDKVLKERLEAIKKGIEIKRIENGRYKKVRKYRIVDPPVRTPKKHLSELDPKAGEKIRNFKEKVPLEVRYKIKYKK